MIEEPKHTGMLSWFATNHVAANLLMLIVLAAGAITALQIKREVFPSIETGLVTVQVPYLGASPDEVEEGVSTRVEEAIEGIEGIKRIRSIAQEGFGTVIAELEDYANKDRALNDIEAAVDRIDTFPKETDKPVISETNNRVQVLTVVLYGKVNERTLKELAHRVRDDLTAKPDISQAVIVGTRPYEVSLEISEEELRRYGLTFEQVADAVSASSLDLPGGSIKTRGGEILIRTKGQRYRGSDFEPIVVIRRPDGTDLTLDELADIDDGFEDVDVSSRFNGLPSVMINVFRIGEQDALEVANIVNEYVDAKQGDLPEGVTIDTWFDRSQFLQGRIDLLIRNARIGLILVFLCLMLFLDLKLAFWTTMGIPISFLGAFWLLPMFDVTINMLSLFAFIVVLGIVVDDAIVVGENIYTLREKGMKPIEAAIKGVREMAMPVTMAILTTVVAFVPLLFTAGMLGKLLRVIPIVVICVLLLSLVEALLILPAHLCSSNLHGSPGPLRHLQEKVEAGLNWFIEHPYMKTLRIAVAWRYVTVAIAMAMFIATIGYVAGGHIKFTFLPKIDADHVVAQLDMPQGTPVEQTEQVVKRLEEAAVRVKDRLDATYGDAHPADESSIKQYYTVIGTQPFKGLVNNAHSKGETGASNQSHLAEIMVEMLNSQTRTFLSSEAAAMWREELGPVAGVQSLTFSASYFSAGEAVNVELSHRDFNMLLRAVNDLKTKLGDYAGVFDIDDSFEAGKQELVLKLKPQGRLLGLTLKDLASQVRQGFYGEEVQRIQRGRDDVKVMLRYPDDQRSSLADIENMRIRVKPTIGPNGEPVGGAEVPFYTVAEAKIDRGYALIRRTDRRRVVSVTGDIDESVANANEINADLVASVLPELSREYPGLTYSFVKQTV